MGIRRLKDSREALSQDNLTGLLTDVMLPNIHDVMEYQDGEEYFIGDLVHTVTDGKHKIFKCVRDGIMSLNELTNWIPLEFDQLLKTAPTKTISDLSAYTFRGENPGKTVFNIITGDHVDEDTEYVPIAFHSLYGFLAREEYTYDRETQDLSLIDKDLKMDQTLTILLFTISRGDSSYGMVQEWEFTNQTGKKVLVLPLDRVQVDDTSKTILYSSLNGFIPPNKFTVNGNTITLQVAPVADESINVLVFNKQKTIMHNSIQYTVYTAPKDGITKIPVSSDFYKYGRDRVILFHSVKGFHVKPVIYSKDSDTGRFIMNVPTLNKGQSLTMICFSTREFKPLADGLVGMNNLTTTLIEKVERWTTNVEISVNSPKATVDLPEFAKQTMGIYTVTPVILEASGDVGDIRIKRDINNFQVEMTGICNHAIIQVTVRG